MEKVLYKEFEKLHERTKEFLINDKKNYTIYPKYNEIFSAFNHTPIDNVKVVILGQDPYHGEKTET